MKVTIERRILSAVTILALMLSLFAWTAATAPAAYADDPDVWDGNFPAVDLTTDFDGGTGTQADPYIIDTAEALAQLAVNVNSGGTTPTAATSYSGKYFWLTNDLDLGNYAWTPIGGASYIPNTGVPNGPYFSGTFDGYYAGNTDTSNTRTISGLNITISSAGTYYGAYGLFGYVNGGVIQNLTLGAGTGISTTLALNAMGAFVGYTNGTLYNLHNTGTPVYVNNAGASQAGGIAGTVENNGSDTVIVQYCSNSAPVTGRGRVGGIVGAVYCANAGGVVVDNCFNKGNLTTVGTTQKSYTGGIVGYCRGYITNSYSIAKLSTSGGHYMAGIVGILQAEGPQAAMSNVYSYSVFAGADVSYDRFLFGSADSKMYVPISNALWVNTNTGGAAWIDNPPSYNNVVISQPDGTSTANWGTWTDVGYFASGTGVTGDPYVYTSKTEASVYTTGAATPRENDQDVITILNDTSSVVFDPETSTETLSLAGAFEQASGYYPNLIWEGNPSFSRNPGGGGPVNSDDATQIFLDVTATGASPDGTQGNPYNTLSAALTALGSASPVDGTTERTVIYVVKPITLSGNTPTIGSEVEDATIKRSSTLTNAPLFTIVTGATVYLGDDPGTEESEAIIISGNSSNVGSTSPLFSVSGGSLTIGNDATLEDNLSNYGGAIYASGGTVTLDGGSIANNIASTNMTSGSASDPGAYGGGVSIDGAAVTFSSGIIEGNQATSHINNGPAEGGGIYLKSGSLTVTGGAFAENRVDGGQNPSLGAGVYVDGGTFTVSPAEDVEFDNEVYLTDGQVIYVGSTLYEMTEIPVQVESPDNGVPVAEGVDDYELNYDDIDMFEYFDGGYVFELDEDANQIILQEESR
jgi:hypothetical protein